MAWPRRHVIIASLSDPYRPPAKLRQRPIGQRRAKLLHIWPVEGYFDPSKLVSNSFEMVWPPKSGRMESLPEIDRGAWLQRVEALAITVRGRRPILEKFYSDFTR